MGLTLSLRLRAHPPVVLDIADNGLVRVDRDVLDRDLLLASAAVVTKSLCEHDYRALRFVGKLKGCAAYRWSTRARLRRRAISSRDGCEPLLERAKTSGTDDHCR
jgi:hypothetical protein